MVGIGGNYVVASANRTGRCDERRDGVQIKLERDQQTFFFMSNFRDAKSFQLTAYSHVSKDVWQPIWNRLIEELTAKVGSQQISAAFEY
jgi:hypothetical protein